MENLHKKTAAKWGVIHFAAVSFICYSLLKFPEFAAVRFQCHGIWWDFDVACPEVSCLCSFFTDTLPVNRHDCGIIPPVDDQQTVSAWSFLQPVCRQRDRWMQKFHSLSESVRQLLYGGLLWFHEKAGAGCWTVGNTLQMQCSVAGQPGKEKSETGEEIKISSATVEKIKIAAAGKILLLQFIFSQLFWKSCRKLFCFQNKYSVRRNVDIVEHAPGTGETQTVICYRKIMRCGGDLMKFFHRLCDPEIRYHIKGRVWTHGDPASALRQRWINPVVFHSLSWSPFGWFYPKVSEAEKDAGHPRREHHQPKREFIKFSKEKYAVLLWKPKKSDKG